MQDVVSTPAPRPPQAPVVSPVAVDVTAPAPAPPQTPAAAPAAPPQAPTVLPLPIAPAAPAPPVSSPAAVPTTQFVENIPLHQPNQAAPAASAPVMQMPSYAAPPAAEPSDDLEKILQAVNNRVNTPLQPQPKLKNKLGKLPKIKLPAKSSRPIGAMIAVVLVVVLLCAVAVMSYHQGGKTAALAKQPGKVGTSYASSDAIQSAGGTLVRPSDLDDYSQTLNQKLNSLNDSQDFSAAGLSTPVIGL